MVISFTHETPGTGVPQGAVLGPLTFLIYMNDIIKDIKANIKLFADDTSLFIEVDDPNIAAEVLNSDLDKIKLWADQWLALVQKKLGS